jgi:transglutaminase-like putative cysteine protease
MSAIVRRYRVEHATLYRYSAPVTLSHQQLHLAPRALPYQRTLSHEVSIEPEPTRRHDGLDAFRNPLTEIAIEAVHDALDIVARSCVDVTARSLPERTLPWEEVAARLAYRAGWEPPAEILEATQFLYESPHVRVKRDLRGWAGECFEPGRPVLDAARALMGKIHAEFEFDAGATSVVTPILRFFEQRRGVCQDFAHLMISCLRSLGLAARYVSGYLLTHPPAGERRAGADASHAWVSLLVPGHGWVDLDPTNDLLPGLEHVTLGWGRDFSDVTPVRGVINGGGSQSLAVRVSVEIDAEQVPLLRS